jgi:predicted nucleotidyltransferase
MSFLEGSRIFGAQDERSDYDIVIVTDPKFPIIDKGLYLTYCGVKVHFYYRTIDKLIGNYYTNFSGLITLVQLRDVARDELIYENENYKDLIERLFERKSALSKLAMLKYAKSYDRILEAAKSQKVIDSKDYSKDLYHLCYISYRLSYEAIDIDLLKSIKRCKTEGISEDLMATVVDRLIRLKRMSDFYTIDELVAQTEPERIYVLTGKNNE